MKRNAIIYIGILLLLLAAVTAWRMRPEPVEGSELYQRYKDLPGVRVGFIKDFPLNDSLTCDVTTFEALTDEGWQWMLNSLGMQKAYIIDSTARSEVWPGENADNVIICWLSQRFHPEVQGDSNALGNSVDFNLVSPHYRWLAVYHATSDEELDAVINFHIKYQMEHSMPMMPTKDNTINL